MSLTIERECGDVDADVQVIDRDPARDGPAKQGIIYAVEINGRFLTPEEIEEGLAKGRAGYFGSDHPDMFNTVLVPNDPLAVGSGGPDMFNTILGPSDPLAVGCDCPSAIAEDAIEHFEVWRDGVPITREEMQAASEKLDATLRSLGLHPYA